MKKTYINPSMMVMDLHVSNSLLAGSGGVTTESTLGNDYNKDDVTYGREDDFDEE